MIELIRLIGVKGNITQEEVRKAKTRAAKARNNDEAMRRLFDGRAELQLSILDEMRRSMAEWKNAKALEYALGREAGNISRALLLLEKKGLLESKMLPMGAADGSARKIKHYRIKESARG